MTTAREYFDKDSSQNLRVHASHEAVTVAGGKVEVIAALSFDFEAGVKYGLLYVPDSSQASSIFEHYLKNIGDLLKVGENIEVEMGFSGTAEKLSGKDLAFSGRINAYAPSTISVEEKSKLIAMASEQGLSLVIRDGDYVAARSSLEKPLAFISHDSRDKAELVREIASNLQKMLCPVWYDEYSLVPGASLRASIEKGIKECKKCVLILSPNFLSNGGWTKAEFDSIFTREILDQSDLIVPVWDNVSQREVYEYSPRLADKVAIPSSLGAEEVARQVLRAINIAK